MEDIKKELTVGTTDNTAPLQPTLKKVEQDQLRTAETPTEEVVEEVEDNRSPARKAFDAWVQECIYNSPLSEHTVSYNYLLSQLPALEAKFEEMN